MLSLNSFRGLLDEERALQLALCLTDDALACLILISPEDRHDYGALVGALRRRCGQCVQPGLLRSELSNRRRQLGEPLRVLANDIESLSRRAYAHMPPSMQSELARDQFIQTLSPTGGFAHRPSWLILSHYRIPWRWFWRGRLCGLRFQLGLQLGTCGDTPTVWGCGAKQPRAGKACMCGCVAALRTACNTRSGHMVFWGCGQPGHLRRDCAMSPGPR